VCRLFEHLSVLMTAQKSARIIFPGGFFLKDPKYESSMTIFGIRRCGSFLMNFGARQGCNF